MESHSEELGDYHCRVRVLFTRPATPRRRSSRGSPATAVRLPALGLHFKGKVTFKYVDRDEVYEAGDAYYAPPGHIPSVVEGGTEGVEFSTATQYARTLEVLKRNLAAMHEA